jgi:uncharacterized FAD-dependent dehydrogenase
LIKNWIQPIVVDRGKDVQSRRRDLRAIMQESVVNVDSNYCFGEGGAGTYSDGNYILVRRREVMCAKFFIPFVIMELIQG